MEDRKTVTNGESNINIFLMCIHFISCEAAQNAKWLDKDKVNDGSNGVQQSTENLPVSSQSTPTATKRIEYDFTR